MTPENTTPAGNFDVREALGLAIEEAINLGPIYGVSFAGRIADAILAAPDLEVRPCGAVSAPQISDAEALAKAWDEGFGWGWSDGVSNALDERTDWRRPNPYKEARK